MHEIALQYLGKKAPLKLDLPILKNSPIKFGAKEPTWVIATDANLLMKINPKMFRKVNERGKEELEDAADIIAKRAEAEKEEAALDEDLDIDEGQEDGDEFGDMTRAEIAQEAKDKFGAEIKIAGKNLQAVKDAYMEAEKNFLTGG